MNVEVPPNTTWTWKLEPHGNLNTILCAPDGQPIPINVIVTNGTDLPLLVSVSTLKHSVTPPPKPKEAIETIVLPIPIKGEPAPNPIKVESKE